MAKIKNQT